jgi:hypothetical protein
VPDRVFHIETGSSNTVEGSTVADDFFGGIYKKHDQLDGTFGEKFDNLGMTHLRFPGGAQAEFAEWYDLTNPDLVDPDLDDNNNGVKDIAGLSEVLAFAVENDVSVTIIIPTTRYADDIDQGVAEVQAFTEKLVTGGFSELPETVILEIGNEYFTQDDLLSADEQDADLSKFVAESLKADK